jgi:hypothetical protein
VDVLKQQGKVRLIKSADKYSVQALLGFLYWKRWESISFGPYYPMKHGYYQFLYKQIAEELFKECLPGGKFTKTAFHYRRGI